MELRRQRPTPRAALLLREVRGLRRPEAPTETLQVRPSNRRHRDERPRGRRRSDLQRSSSPRRSRSSRSPRLHGLLAAAPGVLHRRRGVRQAADRQRPVQGRRQFVPGQGFTVSRYEDYAGEEKGNADASSSASSPTSTPPTTTLQAGNLDIVDTHPARRHHGARTARRPRHRDAQTPTSLRWASRPTTRASRTRGSARRSPWRSTARPSSRPFSAAPARPPTSFDQRRSSTGYRDDACDVLRARRRARPTALLDEAGFDRSQPVELWFNAGAGHDAWMEAVGNQLRENLGRRATSLRGDLDFAEYLPLQ